MYTLRGKCKELSQNLCEKNPTLKLIRGYYVDFAWGQQQHWWCQKPDGTIIDPTKNQFPSKGNGEYIPFNGMVTCEQCGKSLPEEDAQFAGKYPLCSYNCYGRFVSQEE